MGIKLVQFKPGKERVFEQDVLHFASEKYGSDVTKAWAVTVIHVLDPADWIDLFDIARYSHLDAAAWPDSDAYSITWDTPTPTGFTHLNSSKARRQLVKKIELTDFGAKMVSRIVRFDLATFLNDPLLNWLGNVYQRSDYPLYILTHEAMHSVDDWTHRRLVVDSVPPSRDKEVAATLEEFIDTVGGWPEIKQRYLI